ncbi:MAG: c-type cytochrome [Verrucomicrobiaceae bacterium]|nr:MAG: c-type cytochrome [Verrucomicrobiaceae bacterium]
MVAPGAVITPGFGLVAVDFKNGASLAGNLIAETPEHLDMDAAGKLYRVSRGDVSTVTPPASPMPPMGEVLKPDELRDVVAWLASLNQGNLPPKSETPVALDPATLLKPEASAEPMGKETSAVDPAIMKIGRQQFMVCGACHGQSGEGTAAGPPLAGSEWVNGPEENLIRIQLRGLQGPIKVKGQEYNFPAGMAALAYQTDEQIAAVLTFIRNSFGNSAPAVTPDAVKALRGEEKEPPVTAASLIPPTGGSGAKAPAETPAPGSGKYDNLSQKSSLSKWFAGAIAVLALGWIALMAGKKRGSINE